MYNKVEQNSSQTIDWQIEVKKYSKLENKKTLKKENNSGFLKILALSTEKVYRYILNFSKKKFYLIDYLNPF